MKFIKYLLVASLAMGGGQMMQSCGDDEPDVEQGAGDNNTENPGDNNDPDQPGTLPDTPADIDTPTAPSKDEKPSEKNAEDSKKSLESTANKVAGTFKPEDQKEVTDFAQEFEDLFADFEMPSEWDIYEDEDEYDVAAVVRRIGHAAAAPTVANLTRAANVYELNFARFTGIFEPGTSEWKKTGDSDDIIFRYTNRSGKPVEMRVSASGKNDQFTITDEYEDEEYRVNPPQRVNLTITQGGTSLVDCTVDALVNENGHTAHATANGRIANIEFSSITEATDSKVQQKALVKVDGKSVVTASAIVNGSKMATRQEIENLIDNPSANRFDSMFKNAIANVDVMGEIQVRASGEKAGDIIRAFDTEKWWDSSDYDDKAAAKADCQKACDVANANVLDRMYMNGSKNYDATIKLVPMLDDDEPYWWEWYSEPMIMFNDGTSYTFEGYFGNSRFESVADTWSSLWDSYQNLWH